MTGNSIKRGTDNGSAKRAVKSSGLLSDRLNEQLNERLNEQLTGLLVEPITGANHRRHGGTVSRTISGTRNGTNGEAYSLLIIIVNNGLARMARKAREPFWTMRWRAMRGPCAGAALHARQRLA